MGVYEIVQDNPNMYDYCKEKYMEQWNEIAINIDNCTQSQRDSLRRAAQRRAIDTAFVQSLLHFPDADQDLIWGLISTAHKLNLAHLEDYGLDQATRLIVYDRCISAHQSWNKSSGHSFERYIAGIENAEMEHNEIQFLLKSDLFDLIRQNRITNTDQDINLLTEWAENFDLYAVQSIHGDMHVFGCIQVKTSIRDRVGRDDQFSKLAMESHFWVAEAVLNGDFFNLPKYYAMVNGGSITYPENNWHGVYVMTGVESDGRIYQTDPSFNIMARHAVIAARQFIVDRTQLVRSWIAE